MGQIQILLYRLISLLVLLLITPLHAADRLSLPSLKSDQADQALLLDIATAGTALVAVGDQGTVLRSDDGVSWQQQSLPFSVMLTAVSFVDKHKGWVAGHDGLLAFTGDGGLSWQIQLDGNLINQLRLERLQQLETDLLQRVDAEPDNDLLADQLDSLSWQVEDAQIAQEEGPSVPLLDLWFRNDQEGYVLGAYGLLLRTTDGGVSWQYWGDRLDNPDNFHLNAMAADHRGFLYIAGEAGSLFRSLDNGLSWEALYSPYDGSFFAITEFKQQLYLMGLRGHLFRSADGEQWQDINSGTEATLSGSAVSSDELLLLGSGGVVLSSQDGTAFSKIDSGGRSGFSAGVLKGGKRILVGEAGLLTLEDKQ